MRLMSKSAYAWVFSAEQLFRECHGKVYFWTFTFREVPRNDEWSLYMWHQFNVKLHSYYALNRGLRVIELHRSHGAHFHCLVSRRLPIDELTKLARPFGFGVMWVETCDVGTAEYLAKYLVPDREHFGTGRRLWGTLGGYKAVRVRDIIIDSPLTRTKSQIFGDSQICMAHYALLKGYCGMWGESKFWPVDIREQFERAIGRRSYDGVTIKYNIQTN